MNDKECLQQLLECFTYLSSLTPPSVTHEQALACLNVASSITDLLVGQIEGCRVCPGRYWRTSDAIVEFNKTKESKRHRLEVDDSCCGKAGELSFDRGSIGPGSRAICNACASALVRDKKRGLLENIKSK